MLSLSLYIVVSYTVCTSIRMILIVCIICNDNFLSEICFIKGKFHKECVKKVTRHSFQRRFTKDIFSKNTFS